MIQRAQREAQAWIDCSAPRSSTIQNLREAQSALGMTTSSDKVAEDADALQDSESNERSIRTLGGADDSTLSARINVTLELLPREASCDGEDQPSVSLRLTDEAHQGTDDSSDSANFASLCIPLILECTPPIHCPFAMSRNL